MRGTSRQARHAALTTRFRVFLVFLSLAVILILVRCIYRIDELSNGYNGTLIHDENLFIGLEGVYVAPSPRLAWRLTLC